MVEDSGIRLENGERLDDWLKAQEEKSFPKYDHDKEQSYPERYTNFEKAIRSVHDIAEIGVMAAGAKKWMDETISIITKIENLDERQRRLDQLEEADPVAYLNNHGRKHVDKVIERVSEMLHFFDSGHLTPYEGFFLLCAIQVHDVGNVFGREDHEKKCKIILDEKGKNIINDSFEKKVIEKLALVHGGAFNGERDTISFLTESKKLHDRSVRKKLLAALLRFGDELADDSTRADQTALQLGTVLEGSIIYHRYSEALHTVKIERLANSKRQLQLIYEINSDIAAQVFKKNGKNKYLLDEIYDRTLKMERERRYCMRFLRPCFSLDAIRVEIVIQCSKNVFQSDRIQYTLEERGYPSDPASGRIKDFESEIRSGEEELQYLKKEWGL